MPSRLEGLVIGLIVSVLWVGLVESLSSSRSGGGRGHPGDLVPDGEAFGHLVVAPSGGRPEVPTRTNGDETAAEHG